MTVQKLLGLPLILCATVSFAQKAAFVVGEKVAGSIGFYDAGFKRLGGVKVGSHPHEIALTPDRRTLYVADNGVLWMTETGPGENTVSVVDIPSRRKVAIIDLGKYRRPHGIAFDARSGQVLVSTEKPSQLLTLDPASRQVVRTYDVKGQASHIVLLGPRDQWAYVSATDSGSLSAVNLKSGDITVIACGERPQGEALSPDRKTIFVANSGGASISIFDAAKKQRIGAIETGGKAPVRLVVTPDGKTLIYALQEGRSAGFADIATRKETMQIPLAGRSR
jgi:DNA-binding beta-propeller fold protein YncE